MLPAAELAKIQATTEQVMVDRCVIVDPASRTAGTIDDNTGVWTPDAATTIASDLPCLVAPVQAADAIDENFAGSRVRTTQYLAHLPASAPTGIAIDHRFSLTSSQHDPALVGRWFRVANVVTRGLLAQRMLYLEAVDET